MADAKVPAESLFAIFGSNESDAEDGKWFPFGKTISVKIRRFKSKKSKKVREALEAPYTRAAKFTTKIPEDIQESITKQHIAEGIIVDWKGVTDKNGNELPYSKKNALDLISQLPEFADAVASVSLDLDNYREEVKEDVEKN